MITMMLTIRFIYNLANSTDIYNNHIFNNLYYPIV